VKPFLYFSDIEKRINELLNKGLLDEAGEALGDLTFLAATDTRFVGIQIYVPGADALCTKLGDAIGQPIVIAPHLGDDSGRVPLIIVTELYATGGHSRIVEDLLRLYPKAQVITTGYFPRVSKVADHLRRALPTVDTLQLPADTLSGNIRRLRRLALDRASMIFHIAHHHDVVANAALTGVSGIPTFFIHHSDHRPSLGATIDRFVHIDIAHHVLKICKHFLGERCVFWPQGVQDHGQKRFEYPPQNIVTATSGTANKFIFEGPYGLPRIIKSVFDGGAQEHFHIGDLSPAQLKLIQSALSNQGIGLSRWHHIPLVPSLWQFLLTSPINLFIGSAPLHGLRTAIEVQGSGIPILPFRQTGSGLLEDASHYAAGTPFWNTSEDLELLIPQVMKDHGGSSERARLHYEFSFSAKSMKDAIEETRRGYLETH
jgi:hypothetical protein